MDSNYKENPQLDFPDVDKIYKRFKETGILKNETQRWIYEAIAKDWCIGKSVIDLGCGVGWGTNILGREAIGAYGLDISGESINFANQMFGNQKIKFDTSNVILEEIRPTATFDIVCAIELIEHIKDYETFLSNIKRFHNRKRNTVFFISSPNRNNENIGKDSPNNEYHVREWTAGEFYDILTKFFRAVVLYSCEEEDMFVKNLTADGNSLYSPILAKCEIPI